MLLNYLKLAVRMLIRDPMFTVINLSGLSIGFLSFFGLWEYTSTELRSDQHHKDYERIARIVTDWEWTDDGKNWGRIVFGRSGPGTTFRIAQEFPEVEDHVRILHQIAFPEIFSDEAGNLQQITLAREGIAEPVIFRETKGVLADANVFNFFTIPLIYGSDKNCLNEKNSIVLSQKTAHKFFGDRNPMNELLILNGRTTLKVSGVYKDLPHNSHLDFDFVISARGYEDRWNSYPWFVIQSYVKLMSPSFGSFEQRIAGRTSEYLTEVYKAFPNVRIRLTLQPLAEIPFSTHINFDDFQSRSPEVLKVLAAVSVLILLMAWVNYVNLSAARVSSRMKEIAARKVSGASTNDILKQFFTDAFVMNTIAMLMALTLLQFIRQPASELLNIYISDPASISPLSIIIFLSVSFSGIVITGLYPALLSRAYSPRVLLSSNQVPSQRRVLPSALTTIQYSIAVVLIFCGFIVHKQLNFVLNKRRGIDVNNVFIIHPPVVRPQNYIESLRAVELEVETKDNALEIARSTSLLDFGLRLKGTKIPIYTDGLGVLEDYMPFFKIRVLTGRNFLPDDRKDVIIISRLTATRLGFKNIDDAIGARIQGSYRSDWSELEIIGVIEDLKMQTLLKSETNTEAQDGRGYVLIYSNKQFIHAIPENMLVRLKPGKDSDRLLLQLEKAYRHTFPGNAFGGTFLTDLLNQPYRNERVTRNQITFFILIAIGMACLGLLGMISNKIIEKTREIGIRKTLGASLTNTAALLLKSTLVQILISFVAGVPIGYFFGTQYLQKYSEQITIHWWYYLVPIATLCFFLFITIGAKIMKVARANPVDSLRI